MTPRGLEMEEEQLLLGSYVSQLAAAGEPPLAAAPQEVLAAALPEEVLLIRQTEEELAVPVVAMVLPEVSEQVQLLPEPGRVLQQGHSAKLPKHCMRAAVPVGHIPVELLILLLVEVPGEAAGAVTECRPVHPRIFRRDSQARLVLEAVAVGGLITQAHHLPMRGAAKEAQAVPASVLSVGVIKRKAG